MLYFAIFLLFLQTKLQLRLLLKVLRCECSWEFEARRGRVSLRSEGVSAACELGELLTLAHCAHMIRNDPTIGSTWLSSGWAGRAAASAATLDVHVDCLRCRVRDGKGSECASQWQRLAVSASGAGGVVQAAASYTRVFVGGRERGVLQLTNASLWWTLGGTRSYTRLIF